MTRLPAPIVVTQVPRQSHPTPTTATTGSFIRADWLDGTRLVVVSPDGQVRLLSQGFLSACDPNVSFDGQRVLFAAKKHPAGAWRIWEIGLDGQGLRAVSPEPLNARHPIYAATLFTLDSPAPWPAAVFVAQESRWNEIGQPSGSSLYNVKLDGTELRRLTFNPNHNSDPFQMWDGRIIYAAERYANTPGVQARRVGLYAIHVEGADMEFYGGALGKGIQETPCATDQGLVVFIESDEGGSEGGGQLACVEEPRPHVSYRRLTKDPSVVFRFPAPLKDSRILVSRRAMANSGDWGVFSFDTQQGLCEPVFDSPDYDDVQSVLVQSRHLPDGHSTVVDTKADTGIFYGLNCYDSNLPLASHVQTGMVKRVRLIEGVPQVVAVAKNSSPLRPPFVSRRLVGEAPVEADGSFNVEVPADVPLLLQSLDERGMALASCGWIWVKPKEKRGCIGCHEDPERIPENQYVLALRRPSNRLVLPPSERRAVSFRDAVAPILQRRCATAGCHGSGDSPLYLPLAGPTLSEDDLQQSYATLLQPAIRPGKSGIAPLGQYVNYGQARTSWLIWQLEGRDTSRPWDPDSATGKSDGPKIAQMPPVGKGEPLTPEELRTIIQWIDMGAQLSAPQEFQDNPRP